MGRCLVLKLVYTLLIGATYHLRVHLFILNMQGSRLSGIEDTQVSTCPLYTLPLTKTRTFFYMFLILSTTFKPVSGSYRACNRSLGWVQPTTGTWWPESQYSSGKSAAQLMQFLSGMLVTWFAIGSASTTVTSRVLLWRDISIFRSHHSLQL